MEKNPKLKVGQTAIARHPFAPELLRGTVKELAPQFKPDGTEYLKYEFGVIIDAEGVGEVWLPQDTVMPVIEHDFKEGDKVRITNVSSHMYGEANFNEGDVVEIFAAVPFMGVIPAVFIMPTKADATMNEEPGVPFANEDLAMLTRVEAE